MTSMLLNPRVSYQQNLTGTHYFCCDYSIDIQDIIYLTVCFYPVNLADSALFLTSIKYPKV